MIRQIEFLKKQIELYLVYLNFDYEQLTGRRLVKLLNEESTVISLFPGVIKHLRKSLYDVKELLDSLIILHSLLKLPKFQRLANQNKIDSAKFRLKIGNTQPLSITTWLEEFFYFLEQYAFIYQNELPYLYKQVKESAPLFQQVSISRFNYQYFLNKLSDLDENVPEHLQNMISILEEGRVNEFK